MLKAASLIAAATLFVGGLAFAQSADPTPTPVSSPSAFVSATETPHPPALPPAREPDEEATLTRDDINKLQAFVSGSNIHVTMPDGTSHPMVDGSSVLKFINDRMHPVMPPAPANFTPRPTPSASPTVK